MGADGIGPEVVNAAVEVLKVLSDAAGTFQLDFTDYDWSSETYKKTGKYIPDGGLEDLKKHDAILFGAVGAPDVPDHLSLWGLRLAICQPFQQYANVRPTRILKGTESPLRNANTGDLDWVIVRENSEGEYAGQGGRSHRGVSSRRPSWRLFKRNARMIGMRFWRRAAFGISYRRLAVHLLGASIAAKEFAT